ncbi:MAG: hypothetical protein JNL49_11055 [Bacteroidia bacterium]|nr:hypothetical protein [Bacteroidia bacterium]
MRNLNYIYLLLGLIIFFIPTINYSQAIIDINSSVSGQIDYIARDRISFKDGFTFLPVNSGDFVHARIEEQMQLDVTYTTDLEINDINNYQIDQSLPVGYIEGQIDISISGACNYTIPIPLPEGTNKMTPSLAINYNSYSGNGLLGVGWGLSGLSEISRTSSTIYHDGEIHGINLNNSDKFSLDNNRLVNYNGNNYLPEFNSSGYSLVVPVMQAGSGTEPSYWVAHNIERKRYFYGLNVDSRVIANGGPNNGKIIKWLLSKVIDINGNYITYHYGQKNGEYYIEKIEYTGNDNASLTPYAEINFLYDTKSDQNISFLAGSALPSTLILRAITIIVEGQVINSYNFNYSNSFYTHLVEIHKLGNDFISLNPTKIYWGETTSPTCQPFEEVQNGQFSNDASFLSGDLNGDGMTDLIKFENQINYSSSDIFQIWLSDGDGLFHIISSQTYQINNFKPYLSGIADLNGDGNDDILFGFYDGYNIIFQPILCYSNGNILTYCNTKLIQAGSDPKISLGDFTGDGKTDLLHRDFMNPSLDLATFNMYELLGNDLHNNAPPLDQWSLRTIRIVDHNGDGKDDIMCVIEQQPVSCVIYDFSPSSASWNVIYSSGFPTKFHQIYTGDFNGDSKTDLLVYTSLTGQGDWFINYSNGLDYTASFTPVLINVNPAIDQYDNNIFISDFNGDGKSDILEAFFSNSGSTINYKLHWARGIYDFQSELFQFPALASLVPYRPPGFDVNGNSSRNKYFSDFNGDGKADLFFKRKNTAPCHSSITFYKGQKKHLVHGIVDGFAQKIVINYLPLTDNLVYSKGPIHAYPLKTIEIPLYVVRSYSYPINTNSYNFSIMEYEGAIVHLQGKGLMGFKKVKKTSSDWKTETSMSIALPYYHPVINALKIYRTSSNDLFKYTTVNTGFENQMHPLCFQLSNSFSIERNYDHNTTIENELLYDNGKLIQSSEYYYQGTGTSNTLDFNRKLENVYTWIPSLEMHKLTNTNTTQTNDFSSNFNQEWNYSYDLVTGNLIQIVENPTLSKSITTNFSYNNSIGLPSQITKETMGAIPRIIKYEYDKHFRFISKEENSLNHIVTSTFNPDGTVAFSTDIANNTIGYHYDGNLHVKDIIDSRGNITSYEHQWQIGTFPADPNILYSKKIIKPDNSMAVNYFDGLNREIRNETYGLTNELIISKRAFDTHGNISTETKPFILGDTEHQLQYFYNESFGKLSSINDDGILTSFTYNDLSQTTTSPINQITRTNDAFGRIKSIMDNSGSAGAISYNYHANSSPSNISVGLSNWSILYDDIGNQSKLIDQNAGVYDYDYNGYGELLSVSNTNQGVTSSTIYNYDGLGRIISSSSSNGNINYSYYNSGNGIGLIQSISGPNSSSGISSKNFEYDKFGNLIKSTEQIHSKIYEKAFTYDHLNRLIVKTYPNGFKLRNEYNGNGYLNKILNDDNNALIWQLNSVNSFGMPISASHGNATQTSYIYNPKGLITDIQTTNIVGSGLASFHYEYDPLNLNMQLKIYQIGGNSLTDEYTFDNLDRLTSTQTYLNGAPVLNQTLNYEANGNIISKSDIGNYTYDSNKKNAVVGINTIPALISGDFQEIHYNNFNMPDKIEENGKELNIFYNWDNHRIKSEFRQNGQFLYSRYFVGDYEEVVGASSTERYNYIYSPYGLIAINLDIGNFQDLKYVLTDNQHSIIGIVDQNRVLEEFYSYDSWGLRRDPATGSQFLPGNYPSFLISRGFTGHEHLDEFGLINMNARLYDPSLARVLSADNFISDVSNSQNYNRYSYCLNNPINKIDPDGNEPISLTLMIGAALIGGSMNLYSNWGNIAANPMSGLTYFTSGAVGGVVSLANPVAGASIIASMNMLTGVTNGSAPNIDNIGDLGMWAGSNLLSGMEVAGVSQLGVQVLSKSWTWIDSYSLTRNHSPVSYSEGGIPLLKGDFAFQVTSSKVVTTNIALARPGSSLAVKSLAQSKLIANKQQIWKKFGEHYKDFGLTHSPEGLQQYLKIAQEVFQNPILKHTFRHGGKYSGETWIINNGRILRLDPQGKFRSLYLIK